MAAAVLVALRALWLRHALVDRPYRTRALWTAIGGLSVVGFAFAGYVDGVFGSPPTTDLGIFAEGAAWGLAFLLLYGWIFASIAVAVSADFFNRDALSWKRGGKYVATGCLLVGYTLANIPPWLLPAEFTYTELGLLVVDAFFIVAAAYPTAVLAIVYRRIQDPRVKRYTLWLVLSFICLTAGLFSLGTDIAVIPALAWGYAMNGSVGALAIRTRNLQA